VEVVSADVDGVESLMEGMTILPSIRSVVSVGFGTAPTPTSLVTGFRMPSIPPRSGGSREDNISVLLALTAPAALSGRSMFGGNGGKIYEVGHSEGGGWSTLRVHPKMPKFGKYSLLLMNQDDEYCRGFIGGSRDLICVNKSCAIIAHSKPSSKWVQPKRVVFVHPAIKVARSLTAFVLPGTVLSGDGLPENVLWSALDATKTPKQWLTEFIPFAQMKAA
jgi:hypothetical protein